MRLPRWLPLVLILLLCPFIAAQCSQATSSAGETTPTEPGAAAPSAFDDYQVIMWVTRGVPENEKLFFDRLRAANINGMQVGAYASPEVVLRNDFAFYVENVHRIGFLHDRTPIYQADWEAYTKTRDKKYLVRKPCLHDPAHLGAARQRIQESTRPFVGANPIMYDMGDECSIGRFSSPTDYCFAPHTLARFREWLKDQYGSLHSLNVQWDTNFAGWEAVAPFTTYEIKDRERAGSENYSPWADHRTFMDNVFSDTFALYRQWLREIDPSGLVGLEGTQMPAAFGGYDLWKLSQVFDWMEPYDIGNSHDMFRSFMPQGAPILATLFEHDSQPTSRRLWHLLLNGDRGVIIWCSADWYDYDSADFTPQPWVEGMGKLFAELRGPAARAIMHAKRAPAPIAVHYSHPSVQVAWMLDSREDGDTWPRRFSSWEGTHSRLTRNRSSWTYALQDLGLQYDFVSTQQILDGTLEERGYRALILPQSMAIGAAEASKIEAFASKGGTVIADFLPGVFDEHAKRREAGVLDAFFGVSRPASGMTEQPQRTDGIGFSFDREQLPFGPAEPGLRLAGARSEAVSGGKVPVLVVNGVGEGRAVYLNISLIEYGGWRLRGEEAQLLDLLGKFVSASGARPAFKVSLPDGGAPVGCEVVSYQGEGCRYLAIMPNPEYRIGALGEIGEVDNSRFEKPQPVVVDLGGRKQVKELLSGKDLGTVDQLEVTVPVWKPVVLELR